ncbi:MAG: hypothetical protein R3D89_07945 [Sphingomonadaceae bacterium]
MIGKIIGAFAGSKLANSTSKGLGGPMGAAAGVAVATAAKRLSLPALVAITAGGWLVKKALDRKASDEATEAQPEVDSAHPATAPI